MMDCKRLREVMDLYVDSELSEEAATQVRAHMRECAPCRSALEALFRLRAAVRTAAGNPQPSAQLVARVRNLIAPRWYRRGPARALALGLAAAILLAFFSPGIRGTASTGLDRLSHTLDDSRHVALEGVVLCRDCELARRYGYHAKCSVNGHQGWLATADGRLWSILEGDAAHPLLHDTTFLGKRVRVQGRIFRKAGSIEVSSYTLPGGGGD